MTENVNETVEVSVNSVADATEEKQTKSTTQSFRTKEEIDNLIQQRLNGTDNGALSWIENCCINLIKNNKNLVIGSSVWVISIKSKNDIVIYKSFFKKEKSGDRVFNIQEILEKENFAPTKIEKVYVFNESGSNLPEDLERNIENIKEDIVISEYNTESNLEEGLKYFNIGINKGQPVNIYVNGNKSKLDNTKGDITLQKDSSGKYPKIEIKEPQQIEIESDNIFKDISDDDELQLSYMIDGHQYLYLKTSKGRCSACVHVWSCTKYYSDANACTGEILKGKKTISLITESGNRDTSDAKQKHILTDNTVSLNLDNYNLNEETQKSMLTSAIINGEVQKTLTVTLTLLRKVAYKFIDRVYPNQRVGKLWDKWISSTAREQKIWDAYKEDHKDWITFSNPKIPESNTEMMDWGNYDVFINNHKDLLDSHWGIQNRFTIKNNIIRIKDHVRNISSHQQSHNLEPDAVFDAITYMREIVDIFKCKEISKELLNYQKRLIESSSLDTFKEKINNCLDETLTYLREEAYDTIYKNIINKAIDEINTVGQWYDNVLENQDDKIPKKYKDDWANFKNDNEDWQNYNNGRENISYNTRMLNWGNYYIYINEFWDDLQNEKHTLKDCTQKLAKLVENKDDKKKDDKKKDDKPYNYELKDNIKDTEIYNAITYLREILRALNKKLESLNKLHVSLVEFATSADPEELNNKLKTVESRNAKLAEQLEEVSKDKESLTKELNNKLEKVEGEKVKLTEQLSAANKIIEELKGKICPTSSVVTTQPVAYIIFGFGDTSKQYVLPIYDNKVNYYATLNAKDIVIKNNSVSEDEILEIPRTSLSGVKIAFKIEKSNNSKDLYLKDLVGNLTFLSNQSGNAYRLSNNSIFYVEGNGTKFTGKYSRL